MTKIKVFFTYTSIRIYGLEHNQSNHRLLSNLKDLVLFNSYKILLICAWSTFNQGHCTSLTDFQSEILQR